MGTNPRIPALHGGEGRLKLLQLLHLSAGLVHQWRVGMQRGRRRITRAGSHSRLAGQAVFLWEWSPSRLDQLASVPGLRVVCSVGCLVPWSLLLLFRWGVLAEQVPVVILKVALDFIKPQWHRLLTSGPVHCIFRLWADIPLRLQGRRELVRPQGFEVLRQLVALLVHLHRMHHF